MGDFVRSDKREEILSKLKNSFPRVKLHFSGSTPPEIFVGKFNYPNVFSGILAPTYKGDTSILSSSKSWVRQNVSIDKVLSYRGEMIYGRQISNVKNTKELPDVNKQIALSSKSLDIEVFLKKEPLPQYISSNIMPIMSSPAPVQKVILEENPKIEKKVDYIYSDHDAKSVSALKELYNSNISVEHIQKLFSSGLLGKKSERKLVPTRWGITAVDNILSDILLQKIRTYSEIESVKILSSSYAGNYYNIILIPGSFQFEVIEWRIPNIYNLSKENLVKENIGFWQDSESYFKRKKYATSVTGAYYANRLSICEYLEKLKRQATVIVLREITDEYYAPLGVGILREITKMATENIENAGSIDEALSLIDSRIKLPIQKISKISKIIHNIKNQKSLSDFN